MENNNSKSGKIIQVIGAVVDAEFPAGATPEIYDALEISYKIADSDIERLVATVHKDNIASHKILKKVGFTHEGTLRKYLIVQGERTDFEQYSFLRSDLNYC